MGGPPGPPPVRTGPKGKGGGPAGGAKPASGGCKASPVADNEMLYVGMSSKSHGQELGPMWAIRAGAHGDISLRDGLTSNSHIAWFRNDAGPHFTSATICDDRLYVFPPHDGGVLRCFDAKTGATVYEARLEGAAGFKASPCACDGRVFCTDELGTTFVIEAGPKFKLLGRNSIDEMSWSSPALAGGAIFLRTVGRLYCIAAEGPPAGALHSQTKTNPKLDHP
jgi:outer membrane protein assembly factor BamB